MTYNVGISTGFWNIARDPALLGLAQKIAGFGATGGIRFVQVDLERLAEFYEPDVEREINRMREKLGLYAGLHGDINHFSVDTAEKQAWDQTHIRLCQTMAFAAKFKFLYVDYHFSSKPFLNFTESRDRLQGYFTPVVDPWGRPFSKLINHEKNLEDEAIKHIYEQIILKSTVGAEERQKVFDKKSKEAEELIKKKMEEFLKQNPNMSEEQKQALEQSVKDSVRSQKNREFQEETSSQEFILKVWYQLTPKEHETYILEDGEFGAFMLVAKWMKEKGDYLWKNIVVNGAEPIELYNSGDYDDVKKYHAAVVSKYIEGHLTVNDHPANKTFLQGMSVKEFCEKNKVYILFENPEAGDGAEASYRLFVPSHLYHAIKNLNSPYVKMCIDFEHMVSQAIDPNEAIPKLPGDFGKYLMLLHIGQPVPYGGTAHIPISRGSIAQEQIYKWAYEFRKKGWSEGYMLFERGGGRGGGGKTPGEVFEDSVAALRQIALYLEKGTEPRQLPLDFYGISYENVGVFAKQEVAIREHAWDPLEGTLRVPEEKHTFLSGFAVQQQKGQEWEKRKYR